MSEVPITRGHFIAQGFAFIESYYREATAQRILAAIPEATLELRPKIEQGAWYSREHCVALTRAIASIHDREEDVFNDLLESGRYMAREATNSYLKLLLRVLSPSVLARKIPSFWLRDNRNSGNFDPEEAKVSSNYLRLVMKGVEGFDHVAPQSAGFCSFILNAMGKKNIHVQQTGWSLDTPGPNSYALEFTWG